MKRAILLLFSFVSIFSALIAAPIERTAALQLARQFLSQTSVSQFTRSSIAELESEPAYTAKDAMTGTPHFYVYNLSNDGGFVIVAADTRVRTILGYSFNGGFDEKNIPVNMREWLEEYSSQIAYAIKQLPETATAPVVTRGASVDPVVGPLLGNIMYHQEAPYNNLCPMDGDTRSLTGCVATAMTQVMRYYQHPEQGVGTKTYTTETLHFVLSVDFSATTYDWANMLESYNASATDPQKTAVATLMYHAGVAAEMDYTKNWSGASAGKGALALYQHFNYDIGVNVAWRHYYSEEEWLQLIKTELNATRPVIMSGRGSAGGHAFVCDGYATNDFVHINWGWGGWKDGYFQISALNVDGIGDFNLNQSVYYGIQKPQPGSVPNYILGIEKIEVDKASISGDETAQFDLFKVTGRSLFTFKGQIALALYDNEGNFVKIIKIHPWGVELEHEYFYTTPFSFANIGRSDIRPNESTTGTFYIRPVCKPQGEDVWKPVLVENGKVSEIPAVITDTEINFFIPEIFYLIEVSANPIEGGTVTGGGSFAQGASHTVTATANTGYTFTNWTENGTVVSTEPSYTFTVDKARSLVANFVVSKYAVTFAPSGNGTLRVFHGETEIPSGTQVEHGTNLRVQALPDTGYELVSLKANGHDIINDTVTVTEPTEIVAMFAKQQFPVNFTQPAHGTLKVFHGDIEIESGTPVEYGTSLRVETVADTGYELVSLKANGHDIINDTLTVTGVTDIVAVFAKQQFPVNFTQPAHGTLKVFNGESEIESGTQVEHGTNLRVQALPDVGYELVSLQANGQDIINDTVTVTGATEIVAMFAKLHTVTFTQPAHGTLKVFHGESEIESGTQVAHGTKLWIEVIPDTGYVLVSLKANEQDVINDTVTVTGATDIVAVFAKQQYTVTFAQPANGMLKVFRGTTQLETGMQVAHGTKLWIEVIPDTGYELVSLQANGQAVTNDTVTVTGATEIVALFVKQQFPVNFTQPAHGTLKVFHGETEIESGTPVEYGTNLRVETVADTGYELASLKANGQAVTNDTVTVTGVTEIVAVFTKQQFPVNFTQPAHGTLKVYNGETEIESGVLVEYGTNLRVEALPGTGYKLVSLQANGQDVINDTVTVTGVTEIVAVFDKQQYPITFTQPSNGTLKLFRGTIEIETGASVAYGTKLRVEALPDAGYSLVSLQANGQAIINDTVTVTGATEIVAVIGKQQHTVDFTQPAHGTLKVFRGTTEIPSGTRVAYGAKLRVEAVPDVGYELVSLKANGEAIINDTVTVTAATEIVAVFAKQQFPVNFTQPANGKLMLYNGGTEIESGVLVEYGTKLRVEVLPDVGYELVSLKANGEAIINDTVTITKATDIVAVFAKQQFPVNFTQPAGGTLKLYNGDTEIESGVLVEYGTKLRVETFPGTGYELVSLQANGQAITNDTVTVTGVTEIVAQFAKQQFPVNFTQPAGGTLKVLRGTTEIESGAQVEHGTKLRVKALPDTGYELVSLQANGQAVTNDTVTVTAATDIVAVFAKQQFPVNFTQPAGGTLKLYNGDTEIESGVLVEYGTKLRVEALPGTGYELVSLQANGQAVTNDTVTVTKATDIVAVFAKQQFPVSFTKPAGGTLKVLRGTAEIQSGTQVEHGTKLRVEALPDVGYKLVSLQANGQAVTNDTVTVTKATEIKALFERWVSTDNYRVKATNAGCPGSNDGKIEVSFAKQLDYTVIVKNNSGFEKTERVTATTYSLTDLAAGNYSVCFTIEGATNYKQCFEVVISQPQDLSVFRSGVAGNHATYRVSGGTRYTVTHNGRRMETTGDVIEVPLRRGRNLIRITAESECQGVFEEELYHNDAHKLILFPNPTTGQFSLILPHGDEEVTVEIISLLGHSVMKEKRRVSHDGLISMNISALPKGIYLVRVNGKTVKHVTKVIKQ